ncbi:AAA family ATPase [Burkholderia multivorans]|uniref:AAA family ATPase n=1 Tax=Burkholderia multivorans TaxID=87883 RepID=UPI0020B289C9|nr:AAA family ATPase [Burkholderia multivorans]
MYIEQLLLTNIRCFGPSGTSIDLTSGLTTFVGVNGAGKTAALQALQRLFGITGEQRRLRRQDFHVPAAEPAPPLQRALALAVATQWRTWKRKESVPRGMRAAQGKLFALEGCGHEAQGAAVCSPGFTTSQGRTGRPLPKGDMADSASPRDGFIGLCPDAGKANCQRQGKTTPCRQQASIVVETWRGSSMAKGQAACR